MRPRTPRSSARHLRSAAVLVLAAGASTVLLSGCGSSGSSPADVSGRYILTLCDADMPATALVDRNLGPRDESAKDMVTIIGLPIANEKDDAYQTPFAQISVSNSVMGPPQAVAVTKDGRWAYVIENTGPAPAGATTVDDLPAGNKLTRLDLSNPLAPVEAGTLTVGNYPMAVDISPDGNYLCVVTQEKRRQLQIVPISEGGMTAAVDWPLMGLDDDENTVPSCVSWDPTGDFLAVTVPAINKVVFYHVTRSPDSISIEPWGAPVTVGTYPYSGKFTPDGRFYITTDMQWEQDADNVYFVEPPQGQLSVVRFDGQSAQPMHEVVAACPVGVNPEGLAISPDGTLVVTANLLRSFLPESDPRITRGGSLSLLRLDPRTGVLTPLDEKPINSMPVGLSFDSRGRFVVVTQFRSFDPNVKTGELAFFHVKNGSNPTLNQADFHIGVGVGPHGVLIVR